MTEQIETEEEKPLDPAVENIRRRMVRLLVISFGSMLIGLMVVFGAIIYKIGQSGENELASPVDDIEAMKRGAITLPAGSRLVSSSLDGNRILLTVELAGGGLQLQVFDMTQSKVLVIYELSK